MENYFKLRKKWGGEKTGDRENRDTILIHQFFPEDDTKSPETGALKRGTSYAFPNFLEESGRNCGTPCTVNKSPDFLKLIEGLVLRCII
jgi:hypothetical protein